MTRGATCIVALFLGFVSLCKAAEKVEFRLVEGPGAVPTGFVWKSEVPEGCPFEQSDLFNRVYFTGRHSDCRCGDTFYPSWASDGNLYSPWTDGTTDGVMCKSYSEDEAHTGHAVMKGRDPLNLIIKNTSAPKHAGALPYRGRYPAGSLVHDGIWYYGTYCLSPGSGTVHNDFTFNWPNLGPMPGFQISYDLGKTWEPSPHTPAKPLFPEPKEHLGPVTMGAPHFVAFGKNMEHSPDGKAYLLGMGAEQDDPMPRPCVVKGTAGEAYKICADCPGDKHENFVHANLSWITADQIFLSRVTPTPETINDENAYEYFAGHDPKGTPVWSSDLRKIKPLLEWNNNMGCVTATYVPQLNKYLMCVTDGWPTVATMDSYILEADVLTGPWRLVTYLKDFGEQAYFLNFPSKFIEQDGRTMWLCYSANFSSNWNGIKLAFNPPGGRCGLCLHKMRFISKDEKDLVQENVSDPVIFVGNLAPEAVISVSSTHKEYSAQALVDGKAQGYPENPKAEWTSNGEKSGAWVKLEWDTKQCVSRVLLFDRPNNFDQILIGRLVFSDDTTIEVSEPLPDRAIEGLEVTFNTKHVTWVKFEVSETSGKALNIGLSEIAVFTDK